MKYLISLSTVLLTLFITACSSVTPYISSTTGRYMHIRNPFNDNVTYQITFPTSDGCKYMLAGMGDKMDKDVLKYVSCTSSSVSQSLPYRATVRNKVVDFIFDAETKTLEECNANVASLEKGGGEIISQCKLK